MMDPPRLRLPYYYLSGSGYYLIMITGDREDTLGYIEAINLRHEGPVRIESGSDRQSWREGLEELKEAVNQGSHARVSPEHKVLWMPDQGVVAMTGDG